MLLGVDYKYSYILISTAHLAGFAAARLAVVVGTSYRRLNTLLTVTYTVKHGIYY